MDAAASSNVMAIACGRSGEGPLVILVFGAWTGGIFAGEEDIFPDPMSASMAAGWRGGVAKALERQNAALAQAAPVPS